MARFITQRWHFTYSGPGVDTAAISRYFALPCVSNSQRNAPAVERRKRAVEPAPYQTPPGLRTLLQTANAVNHQDHHTGDVVVAEVTSAD